MASKRAQIEKLLEDLQPEIRAAFLSAVDDLKSGADLKRLLERLTAGDVEGALRAMNLDPAAFGGFAKALEDAFNTSGAATVGMLPKLTDDAGARVVVRFDARNLRAEAWLREHSSTAITAILDDQRTAIRAALEAGMQRGENPRTTALDIIGKFNAVTGKREGGIVGLTAAQEAYARNYQAELSSTDPEVLAGALARARRDKRFDATVKKAIASGEPIDRVTAAKMVQRYRDSMLKLRGETIARTEALTSLNAAQDEAFRQAIDKGGLKSTQVKRIWRSASDQRVRDTHSVMNGQKRGLNEPFVSPNGARLMFPGDPNAPAGEIINCRCVLEPAIDFFAGLK
jgi:hypothetical protein